MGVHIGRIFGTDIRATGGFFLLLGLYFYMLGTDRVAEAGLFCIAIIVSLLIHEFGHVFAFRWQAQSGSSVILWGLGGLCIPDAPPRDPKQRIVISLMGPAFEAVLGAIALAVWIFVPVSNPYLATLLFYLVWINVFWLVLNLVPVLPLDGGQALMAALELKMGPHKALAVAKRVSVGCAALVIAAAIYLDFKFVAVMGALLLLQNLPGRSESI